MNKVITKVHNKNLQDWYEDHEIKINSINGYNTIYRRIVFEKGYAKRVVIGFTPEERDLAYNSLDVLKKLDNVKNHFSTKLISFLEL